MKLQDSIIIIEAPNKCEKIEKFSGAKVFATKGHFKSLPLENYINWDTYEPYYEFSNTERKKAMDYIFSACRGKDVYIATDPDREGYAIGYMFYEVIKNIAKSVKRAEFFEITQSGINKGIESAVSFENTNKNLYEAFKARSVGDRLCGFILSPKLMKTLGERGNVSVGRVQTPALYQIVTREIEIENFEKLDSSKKIDYRVIANATIQDKKVELKNQSLFATKEEAQDFLNAIIDTQEAIVSKKECKETKSSPNKPFQAATLIQKANIAFGFSSETTMNLAQNLYEKGLITYHRTDAENLSLEFITEVESMFGKEEWYQRREYKAGAQSQAEAHEATRITHCHKFEDIETMIQDENLTKNHQELYTLIYLNSILSQAKDAIYESLNFEVNIKGRIFNLRATKLIYNGFKGVFKQLDEEENQEEVSLDSTLELKEGDKINIQSFEIKDVKKKAPSRFKESDFIPLLQKLGIGRPSTYASFVPTLLKREFIEIITKGKKQELKATSKGKRAIESLKQSDEWITQHEFTKAMEEVLDSITQGQSQYLDFIKPLHEKLGLERMETQSKAPTENQIKLAKDLATKMNLEVPQEVLDSMKVCSDFIESMKKKLPPKPPSQKQIDLALKLSKEKSLELPKNYELDYKICSSFIDKAFKSKPKEKK